MMEYTFSIMDKFIELTFQYYYYSFIFFHFNNQPIECQDLFLEAFWGVGFNSSVYFEVIYFGFLVFILPSLIVECFVHVDRIISN